MEVFSADRGIVEMPIDLPLAKIESDEYPACSARQERDPEKIPLARADMATDHWQTKPPTVNYVSARRDLNKRTVNSL